LIAAISASKVAVVGGDAVEAPALDAESVAAFARLPAQFAVDAAVVAVEATGSDVRCEGIGAPARGSDLVVLAEQALDRHARHLVYQGAIRGVDDAAGVGRRCLRPLCCVGVEGR
jgi:hypothetical protein